MPDPRSGFPKRRSARREWWPADARYSRAGRMRTPGWRRGAGRGAGSSSGHLGLQPDQQDQQHDGAGSNQRDGHHYAHTQGSREVAEGGGGNQAADQRQRENAVEEARMIEREAPAYSFGNQGINGGKAAAHEHGARGCAESVIGGKQDQAAEQSQQNASHQEAAVAHAREDGHRTEPGEHQAQPVKRQDQERRSGADADAADEQQGHPAGDRPFVAKLKEKEQGEQDRTGAAKLRQGLLDGGLRPGGSGGVGTAGIDNGKSRGHGG